MSQYHQRRIAEWHDGRMSSYELLELLEFMPERGAFKTAARGGEFSGEELVWRSIATELSKLRAITESVNTRKSAEMQTFPSLAEMRADAESAEAAEERREDFFSFADRTLDNFDDAELDVDDRRAV